MIAFEDATLTSERANRGVVIRIGVPECSRGNLLSITIAFSGIRLVFFFSSELEGVSSFEAEAAALPSTLVADFLAVLARVRRPTVDALSSGAIESVWLAFEEENT